MESPEKKTLSYKEQSPEKVKEYKGKIKDISKWKIAYIDETGIDSCLYHEYGYVPRGQKVYDKISGRKFQRTNIIDAKLGNEIIAPMQYNSKINSALFEMWFEKHLYQICSKYAFNLIFLTPYFPELNPIEKYWYVLKRKIKTLLGYHLSLNDSIHRAFLYPGGFVYK